MWPLPNHASLIARYFITRVCHIPCGMWAPPFAVGVLLCLMIARVGADTYDECRNPSREGVSLFGGTPSQLRIVIVQCGDTAVDLPDFGMLSSGHARAFEDVPYGVQSIYLNALYAADHGYAYEYFVFNNRTIERYPTWCRVPAMRRALTQRHPPDMVLYLDLDAYIRTDLPISDAFEKTRRSRALTLDDGAESQPCIYQRANVATPLYKGMHMSELQRSFDEDSAWSAHMLGADIVNSGGGWLERNTGSVTFLDDWWALGATWQAGHYLQNPYHEQRILNVLMAQRPELRKETILLEDPFYNSPLSVCIPHMYAGYKDRVDARRQMAVDLLSRLSRVPMDRAVIRIVSGGRVE